MPKIGKILAVDENVGVQMNAYVFANVMTAYLYGDIGRNRTITLLDEHLERHRASKLDNLDKADLSAMKLAFDGLTPEEQNRHINKMQAYGFMVQAEMVNERFFNRKLRLEPDAPEPG